MGGEARSMEETEPEGEGVVRGPGCEAADSTTGTMAEGSGRGSLETNTLRLDGGVALRRGAGGDCRSSRERPVRRWSMCPLEKLRPRVAGPGVGVRGAPEEESAPSLRVGEPRGRGGFARMPSWWERPGREPEGRGAGASGVTLSGRSGLRIAGGTSTRS